MLSSPELNDKYIQHEFLRYLKEKRKHCMVICFSLFILFFVLSCCIPLKYMIHADFLLKKTAQNSFEAVALANKAENKSTDSFNIEPMFYARDIKEKAVEASAYQIQKKYDWFLAKIIDQIKLIYLMVCKKSPYQSYSFINCSYKGLKPTIFKIRKIKDSLVEIEIEDKKNLVFKGEKVSFSLGEFTILDIYEHAKNIEKYRILPLEKSLKDIDANLKIRPEKNSKQSLSFKFFSYDKLQGVLFVKSFIDQAVQKIEKIKKEALEIEINALDKELAELQKNKTQTAIREKINILQHSISQKIEEKKQISFQMEEEIKNKEFFQYLEKNCIIHMDYVDREWNILNQKKERLSVSQKNKESESNIDRKQLETKVQVQTQNIEKIEFKIEELKRIKNKKDNTSWIMHNDFPLLTELFSIARSLEEFDFRHAVTEKKEHLQKIEKAQKAIEKEIEFLFYDLENKLNQEKLRLIGLENDLFIALEKEIISYENQYFNLLRQKQNIASFEIERKKNKLISIQHLIEVEKKHLEIELQSLEKALEIAFIKKELEEKFYAKKIELEGAKFFGAILSDPRSSNFPNLYYRLFLVMILTLISIAALVLIFMFKVANFNFLYSKKFISDLESELKNSDKKLENSIF